MTPFPLVPFPAACTATGDGAFALTGSTPILGDPASEELLTGLLVTRTGLPRRADAVGPAIRLRIEKGGRGESYRLDAAPEGVEVVGADAAGLFYGIQTLVQLVREDGDGWSIPGVTIHDSPRFAYRGAMLDVARHFFPVDVVKGYIDRAAGLKLNALHLHLSDDQGWRLELRSRPRLTAQASDTAVGGRPGGFYTRADYADIVAYAASRHMIVVPEFDVPGHTHAVGLAYPDVAADPVISDTVVEHTATFGGGLPRASVPYTGVAVGFSSLRIDSEDTYDFLADVFGELAGLTPGPYLHLGGDEALGTDPQDYERFVARASRIIADLGKIPIAWHEAGAADLAEGTIGQYWGLTTPAVRAEDDARAFVAAGSRLILSPADAIYLDHKYDDSTRIGTVWADGPTSVERSYTWEPTSILPWLTDDDILGVEAPLWTETSTTPSDLDELAFPRIASAAEIAWSPRRAPERSWESFRGRVGGLGGLWSTLGIGYFASSEIAWTGR